MMRTAEMKWDLRFLDLAGSIATWSRDPSTKCGAVIVRPDRSICSTGFNGFPQSMPDVDAFYAEREEKYSRIIHAEINAILFAREPLKGYALYSTFCPCDRCAVTMIQAGIKRVVFPKPEPEALKRWASSFWRTKKYFEECGVAFSEYDIEV